MTYDEEYERYAGYEEDEAECKENEREKDMHDAIGEEKSGAAHDELPTVWKRLDLRPGRSGYAGNGYSGRSGWSEAVRRASSGYLIARRDSLEEYQKELLYRLLGPVFFGEKAAASLTELSVLFREKYGIDVCTDFCEGDEHYEEYLEAQAAIAEGLSIYGGDITFDESVLAEMAERVWESMEKNQKGGFRRINTMLEE